MLIDNTFFVGELYLANIDQPAVANVLNYMIAQREPEILTDFLGRELHAEFMAGLSAPVPEKKWIELLYGNGAEWPGIIQVPASTVALNTKQPVKVVVADTGSVLPIPVEAQGSTLVIVEEDGSRLYQGVDFNIAGTNINAVTFTFEAGEVVYLQPFNATPSAVQLNRRSFIAHYVYYYFLEREAQQTTGVGQAATKSQNSIRVSPMEKMVKAWNEMVDMLIELCKFLRKNEAAYSTWSTVHCFDRKCVRSIEEYQQWRKYTYITTLDL